MRKLKLIMIFTMLLPIIHGCTSNMEKLNEDIKLLDSVGFMTGFVEEKGKFLTFSANNQGIESQIKWRYFIKTAKKVTVEIDLLKINYYFDNSLKICPPVESTTPEKLKTFIPKSSRITKYKNHTVNVLLVNQKKFNWSFPYNEKESFFAFPVLSCNEGLANSVYKRTAGMYHELFHVFNHGKYLDPLDEEEQAYATEICSLITSKSAKSPSISYLSEDITVEEIARSEFPDYESFSDITKNSINSRYKVLDKLYKGNKKLGSYKSACKSLYGL